MATMKKPMPAKKMPANFEKSKMDKDRKGMKEGSPKEEAMDRMQGMGYKRGGRVK